MGFISVSLSELDPLSSGYRLTITGCNSGDTEVLVASGLTNPDDFPYVFNSDDFLDDGSCFYYNLVDVNSGCQISGSIGTTTPTPTPTNTVTPTPSNTALGIDISVDVTSGSTVVTLTFTASFNVKSNTTVNFEQKLFRTNGTTYTIKDSVIILSGQNVATKTYRLSEDYTNFRPFEYSITNLTSSNDEVTFNKYSTATFEGESKNLIPYIFESCCDRTKTISVLVPNSATIDGWVSQGYIIVFKDECYKPRIKGGIGNNGTYYGFDYKSCYDSPCLCVTPTPTPSVTPTKTPITTTDEYTLVCLETLDNTYRKYVNIKNDDLDKIFYIDGRCMSLSSEAYTIGINNLNSEYIDDKIYDNINVCKLINKVPLNVSINFVDDVLDSIPFKLKLDKPNFYVKNLNCTNPCDIQSCVGTETFTTTVNALVPCGETNSNPDIYVWYDVSGSYTLPEIRQATRTIREWYIRLCEINGYTGRLFEAPFNDFHENFFSILNYQTLKSLSGGTLNGEQLTVPFPTLTATGNAIYRKMLTGREYGNGTDDGGGPITVTIGTTNYSWANYGKPHPSVLWSHNGEWTATSILPENFVPNNQYLVFESSNKPFQYSGDPRNAINIIFTNEWQLVFNFNVGGGDPVLDSFGYGIVGNNTYNNTFNNGGLPGPCQFNTNQSLLCDNLRNQLNIFFKVWKHLKDENFVKRDFMFIFPKHQNLTTGNYETTHFMASMMALYEGEPINTPELQSHYEAYYTGDTGQLITTEWPYINPYLNYLANIQNFDGNPSNNVYSNFSMLETHAPFSAMTNLTSYQDLPEEYQFGPGLKHYGFNINTVLSSFTPTILTNNLCEFVNLEVLDALQTYLLVECVPVPVNSESNTISTIDYNTQIPCLPPNISVLISGSTDEYYQVLENNLALGTSNYINTGVFEINESNYTVSNYTISNIVPLGTLDDCTTCQSTITSEEFSGYTYLNQITLINWNSDPESAPIDVTVYGGTGSTDIVTQIVSLPPSTALNSFTVVYDTGFTVTKCINLELTMDSLPPNVQVTNISDCCNPVPSQTPTPTVTPTMTPTPTQTPTETPTPTPTVTASETPLPTPPSTPTQTPTTTSTPTPTPSYDIVCNVTLSTDQPETPTLCSDDILVNITVTNGSIDGTDNILSLSSITSNELLTNSSDYSYESSNSEISLTIPSQTYQQYGDEYEVCVITDLNCVACTAFTVNYILPPYVQKFEKCDESIVVGIIPYTGSTAEYLSYNIPLEINSICDLEPLANEDGIVTSTAILYATIYYMTNNLYSSILDWNEDSVISTADVLYASQYNGNETGPTAFNLNDVEACLVSSSITLYNNNSTDLNYDETYFINGDCWTYKGLVENCFETLPLDDYSILNTSYSDCQTCTDTNFPPESPTPTPTPTPTPIPICEIFPKDFGVKKIQEYNANNTTVNYRITANTVSHYFQPRTFVTDELIDHYFPGYDLDTQKIHIDYYNTMGGVFSPVIIMPSVCTFTKCVDMWESTFQNEDGQFLNQGYWDGIRVNRLTGRIFTCDYNCETSTPLLDENRNTITVTEFFENYFEKNNFDLGDSFPLPPLSSNSLFTNDLEADCKLVVGLSCDGDVESVYVPTAELTTQVIEEYLTHKFTYNGICYEITSINNDIVNTVPTGYIEYGTCNCGTVDTGHIIKTLPLIIYDEEKDIVFRIWTDEQEEAELNGETYELTGDETVVIKELTNCERNRDIFVTVDDNGKFELNGVTGNTNVVLQKGHTYRFHVCTGDKDFWLGLSDSAFDILTDEGPCVIGNEITISNDTDIINGVVNTECTQNLYGQSNCGTYLREIKYVELIGQTVNHYNKTIVFRPSCEWDCKKILFYYDRNDISNDISGNTVLNDTNQFGLIQIKEDPNNCRSNIVVTHNGYIDEETGLIPDLLVRWIDCCGDSHTFIYQYPLLEDNPNWGEPFDFILPGCIKLNTVELIYAEMPSTQDSGLPSATTQGRCWCGEKYDGTDCWSVCGESKPVFRTPDKSTGVYKEKDGYKVFSERSEKLYSLFTGVVTDKGECCGCCTSNVTTFNKDEYWLAKNCCDPTDYLIARISRRIHGDIVLSGKGFLVDLPAQETVKCYYFDQRVSVGCNDSRNFYTVPPRDIVDNDCDDTAIDYEEALELRKCLPCPSPPRIVDCDLPYDTISGITQTCSEIILQYGTQVGEVSMTFSAGTSSKRIQVFMAPTAFNLDGEPVYQEVPGTEVLVADSLWVGQRLVDNATSPSGGALVNELNAIFNNTSSIPKFRLTPTCDWDIENHSTIWPGGFNSSFGTNGWIPAGTDSIVSTPSDIPIDFSSSDYYRLNGAPGQLSVDPTYPSPLSFACDGNVRLKFNKPYPYPVKLTVKVWTFVSDVIVQDGWYLSVRCIDPCSEPMELWYSEQGPCDFGELQCTKYSLRSQDPILPEYTNVLDWVCNATSLDFNIVAGWLGPEFTGPGSSETQPLYITNSSYLRCYIIDGPGGMPGPVEYGPVDFFSYIWSEDSAGSDRILGKGLPDYKNGWSFINGWTFNNNAGSIPYLSQPESFDIEDASWTHSFGTGIVKKYRITLVIHAIDRTATVSPDQYIQVQWTTTTEISYAINYIWYNNPRTLGSTDQFNQGPNSGPPDAYTATVTNVSTSTHVTYQTFYGNSVSIAVPNDIKICLVINDVNYYPISFPSMQLSHLVWEDIEVEDGDRVQFKLLGEGRGPGSTVVINYLRWIIDRLEVEGETGTTIYSYTDCQTNVTEEISLSYPNNLATICAVNGSVSIVSGTGTYSVIGDCGTLQLNNYFSVNTIDTIGEDQYGIPPEISVGLPRYFVYNNLIVDYLNQYTTANNAEYQGINYFTVEYSGVYSFRVRQTFKLNDSADDPLVIEPRLMEYNTTNVLSYITPLNTETYVVINPSGTNRQLKTWTYENVYLEVGQKVSNMFVKVNVPGSNPSQWLYLYDDESLFEITSFDFVPELTTLFVADNDQNGIDICDSVFFDPCCTVPVEGYFYITGGTSPFILQSDSTGLITNYCDNIDLPSWDDCTNADYGFYLPALVTPNNDGLYDTWMVEFVNKNCWQSFNVVVYSSVGQLVIASFDALTSGWEPGGNIANANYLLSYSGIKGNGETVSGTHSVLLFT